MALRVPTTILDSSLFPHHGPTPHTQDICIAILDGDTCEGRLPNDPLVSAQAHVLAIEDHLTSCDLRGAIDHLQTLSFLTGSLHRLSYADPTPVAPLYQGLLPEIVCDLFIFLDMGQQAISVHLSREMAL